MHRSIAVLVLVCGLVSAAAARPLTVGVRGGSSIPNLRDRGGNERSTGFSSRLAAEFGAFAEAGLTRSLSLVAEIDYAGQGGKRDGLQPIPFDIEGMPSGIYYAEFHNTAKLVYLEVPLLARLRFGGGRHLYADLGPYVGWLLSAKSVTEGRSPVFMDAAGTQPVTEPQDFGATVNDKGDLHTFNWGFQGGIGATRPLGRGSIGLDLRAGLGFADIQKNTAESGRNSTGNLVVAVTYGLPLGDAPAR